MTEAEQVELLLSLGKRLELWTSPGDAQDYLMPGAPLWTPKLKEALKPPARVIDLLMAHLIRIKDFRTQRPTNLILNPAQRNFSRNRANKAVILKAGRAGFTTILSQRGLLKAITKQGYTSLLVAHKQPSAQAYFLDVLFAFNNLGGPLGEEFRSGALRTGVGGRKNARELYFPALNSRFFVETAGEYAPAEGESIQYLIADEMARWVKGDPKQVVATLLSHMTGDGTEEYLVSRPWGQSGEFYERYWAARRGESDFRAFFYQWWWNLAQAAKPPEGFSFTAEEAELAERYRIWRATEAPTGCGLADNLSVEQVAWRRAGEKQLRDLFQQEFAEDESKCFLGSGNCPFSATSIAEIQLNDAPILDRQGGSGETENGLLVWELPNPSCWYVLFVDPAGGLGTSRIAMQVVNGRTGNQAAEWVGRADADSIAAEAASLAVRYGKVIIAVETNLGEVSASVLTKLCTPPHNFSTEADTWPQIYREEVRDPADPMRTSMRFGWKTNPRNRPDMLGVLGGLLRDAPHLFHSKRLANELKSCVRKGDRIEHGPGMTDDLVMAMAGAQKVRLLRSVAQPEPMFECLDISPGAEYGDGPERTWMK